MRRLNSLTASALVLSILFSGRAQSYTAAQQQKPDTVKIQLTEVAVDVVVMDGKNRLITNLAPQDFEVYEDGVLQEVSSFRVIRGAPEKPTGTQAYATPGQIANAPAPARVATPAEPPDMPPSLLIVLLDYSTSKFENKNLIQSASIKYVEQRLRPNDMMAVFVLGAGLKLASDFTNDKPKLISALKAADVSGSAIAADRSSMNATIAAGQSPTMQFQDTTLNIPSPSGRDAATMASAVRDQLSNLGTAIIAQHLAALDFALRSGLDRRQSLGVLSAIRAIAMGVKGIPGRKTLLLFSEGFVVGPTVEEEMRSVTGLANRSQLAIYCVESQGLETREVTGELVPRDELTNTISNSQSNKIPRGGETGFDRARQVGHSVRESPLLYVANSTGGFLIRNTNDLSIGLERIDQEMRSHYFLSYRPKNEKLDGAFRQIRVAVKKPGLTVRARSGYYAMPAGYESLAPEDFQLVEQVHKADAAARLPLFLRVAGFREESAQYRVPVILEIPSASIRFEGNHGRHSANLLMLGLVRNQAGNLVKRFGGPVKVDVSDAEYDVLKPGTVSFVNYVQLPAGADYSFEVLIKDVLSGMVSGGQDTLDLHKSDPALALSTILLARDVDKVSNKGDQFLVVKGARILPLARCQFRNGDNLIFYFDVYGSRLDRENKTDVSISLSLMRDGQQTNVRLPHYRVNESPVGATPHISFARFVRLAGLSPGNYTLIMDVKDGVGNQSARGQAAFSLTK